MAVVTLARRRAAAAGAASAARAPGPGQAPLRVGLFVSGPRQPRALVEALARVAASGVAEIVLLAVCPAPRAARRRVWRAVLGVDRWLFARHLAAAGAADLGAALPRADRIALSPAVPPLAAIAGYRLDVALALGDCADPALAGVARHGLWSLDYGNTGRADDGLEGLGDVAGDCPDSVVRLCVTRPGERKRVLCQTRTRTERLSPARQRGRLLRRAAALPGGALRHLHAHGALPEGLPEAPPPAAGLPPPVATLAALGERLVRRALDKLLHVEQWFLAYRFDAGTGAPPGSGTYRCLLPPRDRFWADPFPVVRGGRHFIFFEELVFAEGKAHIAVIEVGPDGARSAPVRVLTRPYHLSYPFVFEAEGELFMVPETAANRSVELYRCVHFPDRWVLEQTLLRDIHCVDASLYRNAEGWWMFASVGRDADDVHDELHLFHATRLGGTWRPHPRNPVRSDARGARPAGRLFLQDGQLYRPGQIGAPFYGSGIALHRVLTLDREDYRECEVARLVPPDRGAAERIFGLHTLNRAGRLSVVDAFVRRRRWGQTVLEGFEPARLGPAADGMLRHDPLVH